MKTKQSNRKSFSFIKIKRQNSNDAKSSRREFLKQTGYKCIGFAGMVFAANLSRQADACLATGCHVFFCPTSFTCSPSPSYPCVDNRCDEKNTCSGTTDPYFICYRGLGDGNICGTDNECLTFFYCRKGHTCTGHNWCERTAFDCPSSSNVCTPTSDTGW